MPPWGRESGPMGRCEESVNIRGIMRELTSILIDPFPWTLRMSETDSRCLFTSTSVVHVEGMR